MTLELEAESKAAAERKACNAGMDVQHVQHITGQDTTGQDTAGDGQGDSDRRSHRGEDDGAHSGIWIKLVIILAIVAVVGYFAWAKIAALMSSAH